MGIFCDIYGKSLRNQILEFILEFDELDFAVSDIEVDLSKPRKYQLIRQLEKEGIIIKSRVVGGTQLYNLNENNLKVKLLVETFNKCLKLNLVNEIKVKT